MNVLIIFSWPLEDSSFGGIKTIITSYLSNKDLFLNNGIEISLLNYQGRKKGRFQKLDNVRYAFQQYKAISSYLKSNPVECVNIHTSRGFLFVKDIFLSRLIKRKFSIPIIVTIHVGRTSTVFNRIEFLKRNLINCINRYVDQLVLLSNAAKEDFIKEGVNRDKCSVLYNFHNLNLGDIQCHTNPCLQLLFVGAIHREKGVIDILKAVQQLPRGTYHLDICGLIKDDTIREEFNALVTSNEDVTFHGMVEGEEKNRLYKNADVLLLPSYHEGMPMVILEAMSAGCAIIATRVGALPEILTEKNVVWVEAQAPKQIVEAVQLFMQDVEFLERMKEENYSLSESFSMERHINLLSKIYQQVK